MILPRYPIYRVIADVRYAGMWFRIDGDDLYVTGDTAKLTANLRSKVTRAKPAIIAAVSQVPTACRLPAVCLNVGCCEDCQVPIDTEAAS